jgi:thiol:disulfide interchange protein
MRDKVKLSLPMPFRNLAFRFSLARLLILMIPLGFGFMWLRHYFDTRPIEWRPYSAEALNQHRVAGRTVLLVFTADWSTVATYNKKFVLETPPVRRAIRSGNVVALHADCTNWSQQCRAGIQSLTGDFHVPVVAVYPGSSPSKPVIMGEVLTQRQVLDALANVNATAQRR